MICVTENVCAASVLMMEVRAAFLLHFQFWCVTSIGSWSA